jgi:hypothetical protein
MEWEDIMPESQRTVVFHELLHIPDQQYWWGPAWTHWMFPYERMMGYLKRMVNSAKKPTHSMVTMWATSHLSWVVSHTGKHRYCFHYRLISFQYCFEKTNDNERYRYTIPYSIVSISIYGRYRFQTIPFNVVCIGEFGGGSKANPPNDTIPIAKCRSKIIVSVIESISNIRYENDSACYRFNAIESIAYSMENNSVNDNT